MTLTFLHVTYVVLTVCVCCSIKVYTTTTTRTTIRAVLWTMAYERTLLTASLWFASISYNNNNVLWLQSRQNVAVRHYLLPAAHADRLTESLATILADVDSTSTTATIKRWLQQLAKLVL